MPFEKFKNMENADEQTAEMNDVFSKFDQKLDAETLEKLNSIPVRSEFVEIPEGTYQCELVDLCLKESKTGSLMISSKFKILDGDYANQNWSIIFFPINKEFKIVGPQLALANQFVTNLSCNTVKVSFNGKWADYATLLAKILEFSQKNVGHYTIQYTTTMRGAYTNKNYDIIDAFEK